MSLQDDYFELNEHEGLSANHKKALKRIWNAFCDMENQQDDLLDIQRNFKNIIRLCFKQELHSLDSEISTRSIQIINLTKQLVRMDKAIKELQLKIDNKTKKPKKPTKRKK